MNRILLLATLFLFGALFGQCSVASAAKISNVCGRACKERVAEALFAQTKRAYKEGEVSLARRLLKQIDTFYPKTSVAEKAMVWRNRLSQEKKNG